MIGYIDAHGSKDQINVAKTGTTKGQAGCLRILRVYLELTTASPELEHPMGGSHSLPEVPHESGLRQGKVGGGSEEEAAMRSLQSLVSAKSLEETQNVQSDLPIDPRQVQRWVAVGKRVDRLKGLGNAVVPQVVSYIAERFLKE